MADHELSTKVTPETIWFQGKRVLRTIVQTGIPAFVTFAGILPTIIDALGLPVDAKLRLWLLAAAAIVTAVAGALARVMAIPAVNTFLTRYLGLGSVPKSEAPTALEKAAGSGPKQITDGSDQVA